MQILIAAALAAMSAAAAPTAESPKIVPALQARIGTRPDSTHRVWVFFADKPAAQAVQAAGATADRPSHLSPRALARRAQRRVAPGRYDQRDLPVAAGYVQALHQSGAALRRQSRWLNAASVEATPAQIRAIAALPFVTKLQPVARLRRAPLVESAPLSPISPTPNSVATLDYGQAQPQLAQINIIAAHDAGFTGAGIIIGVLDSGFRREHQVFNTTTPPAHPIQVLGEYDFLNDDPNTAPEAGDVSDQHYHGTWILGTMAGYRPGNYVGAAFDASYLLAKTEDVPNEFPGEEDNYVAGLEWIEANGGDVATSSLGYIDWYTQSDLDGLSAVTTIAVNAATDNGLVCCTAAGNEGNDGNPPVSHLIAPADALRVLTCGAVDSGGITASFSSDGPSFDGRVKPELLARGVSTATNSAVSTTNIIAQNGTSLSTPLLAGGVALVVQAHPTWTVDKIRRALFHTADRFLSTSSYDTAYVRGYGIVNIHAAINFVHGDVNGDGFADGRDVAPFIAALNGTNGDANQNRRSDVNADAAVTAADIPVLVADLLGM